MKYELDTAETAFEPESNDLVLKNKLGIKKESDMNRAKASLLIRLYESIFNEDFGFDQLTFEDICSWHKQWLGQIYPWAGCLRGVNMSKGDFPFAGATLLPGLVEKFEADYLQNLEALSELAKEQLVAYLARSHVDFIQIHPFREGNGRISRLLMDVMVAMAGREPLDYTLFTEHQEFYFRSIQAGVNDDYQHIERLINDTLERSSTSPAEGD